MPNKRNGIYKGKPKFDLHGMYSEDNQYFGGRDVISKQKQDENVQLLTRMFPNVDIEVVEVILVEYHGNLADCIKKLTEISEESSIYKMDENTDLAIIACSLLADESQPMGASVLDIYDTAEDFSSDLGCDMISDSVHYKNVEPCRMGNEIFISPKAVPESATSYDGSMHLFDSIASSGYESKFSNIHSFEFTNDGPVNECDMQDLDRDNKHNIFINKNPNILNNVIDSSQPDKLKDNNELNYSMLNNVCLPFKRLEISENDICQQSESVKTESHKKNVCNDDISCALGNQINKKTYSGYPLFDSDFSFTDKILKDKNSQHIFTSHLNSYNGLCLNSSSKTSQEWEKFFSNLEPLGFKTSSEVSRSVGKNEYNILAPPPTRIKSGSKSESLVASSVLMNNANTECTPQLSASSSYMTTTIKSNLYKNGCNTLQEFSAAPSMAAETSLSNSQTDVISTEDSNNSMYSSCNHDEMRADTSRNSSSTKLSPSALEFIPRPLAKVHATPLTQNKAPQNTTVSRNQNVTKELKPSVSPGKKKRNKVKTTEINTRDESICPMPYNDIDNFKQLKLGSLSSSEANMLRLSPVKSETKQAVDPTDPLGWKDVFSANALSLVDPKPQRSKQQKASKGKSKRQNKPPQNISPTHPCNASENNISNTPEVVASNGKLQILPEVGDINAHESTDDSALSSVHDTTKHLLHVSHSENSITNVQIPSVDFSTPRCSRSFKVTVAPSPESKGVNTFSKSAIIIQSPSSPSNKVTLETRSPNYSVTSAQPKLIKNKIQLGSVRTPALVIRRYILEKQPVMILLRGLPGSGKSYLAKHLIKESQQMGVQGVILSSDDFFVITGQYCYNPNCLPEAHDWNKSRALQNMKESRSPIIIDNTNSTMWELLPYAVLALEHSYDVQIFEPDTPWRTKVAELTRKNIHGVRKESIKRMKDRWENFTVDDVLKQASHSIATRKSYVIVPGSANSLPALSELLGAETVHQKMHNLEPAHVTKIHQQSNFNDNIKSASENFKPPGWFGEQTSHLTQKQIAKPRDKLQIVSDKSPKHAITKDYFNQSLERAIVNMLNTPPSPVIESEISSSMSQTECLLKEDWYINLPKQDLILKERQLSEVSWSSEAETPTPERTAQITKMLSGQFLPENLPHRSQDELIVNKSEDISDISEQREKEIVDDKSVCNNQCSTSDSYHTLASSSVISSYHTVDDYDEVLSPDLLANEDIEDVPLFQQLTHMLLQEAQSQFEHVDKLNLHEMGAESLPAYLEQISLASNEEKCLVQPEKFDYLNENQNMEQESSVLEEHQNNRLNSFEKTAVKDTFNECSIVDHIYSTATSSSHARDTNCRENSDEKSVAHDTINGCLISNQLCPSSLVEYSDSDTDDDKELPLPINNQLDDQSMRQKDDLNICEENELHSIGGNDNNHMISFALVNSKQMDTECNMQLDQDATRTFIREVSIDRLTQSSEDSVMSCKEGSLQIDNTITPVMQQKKKKKRIRKGRNPGQFIEDSLKTKSKTQNWSSFVINPSESSNLSGDLVVTVNPKVSNFSSSTQTDPYIFSIVHKLNSPAFNSLQPVELALSSVVVITSSPQLSVSNRWISVLDKEGTPTLKKVERTIDESTSTDEMIQKEEVDLETLQNCFPEYSRKQLEATMAICHNDLEWVTSHLLDSPALYDMEDDDDEGMGNDLLSSERDFKLSKSSSSAVKSLADMCTVLVRNTSKVDADDLEMQVIQLGEDRLQKIEKFGRSRLHSMSDDDLGNLDYWPDNFVLDDFKVPWADHDLNKRQPESISGQSIVFRTSNFDHEHARQDNGFLSTTIKKNVSTSVQAAQEIQLSHNFSSTIKSKDATSIELNKTAIVAGEANNVFNQPDARSQVIMPLDFVKHLEILFGPLNAQLEDKGFLLDDVTARKIYNCLKLLATKNKLKNPNEQQLRTDEAIARAMQDEENTSVQSHGNHFNGPNGKFLDSQEAVPGWTNQRPSWMTPEEGKVNSINGLVNISGESSNMRPFSVADTLHQLRGTSRNKVQANKFQKKMPGAVKSVWYKARWRGQADSLVSIMEEEMAREEKQREQLRIIESTGDMEALATRIKRIELSNLFPSMGPDVLEDIFRSTGFSKEETIRVLQESYNIPPAPMSKDKEDLLNELRKSQQDYQYVDDFYESDITNKNSGMTYDALRNEATFCRQLALDCQQQALRYQSSGMQGAALFYRQRAKKYKENERTANFKAAQVLFEKGSERLQVENTLDLHLYHLDEAINAVNMAIELKEEEYRKKPDKKNSYLDIVTGWGRNSKNGKPKLKPAIINHLWSKCFQWEERSPGMLRVYINKKLVA